MKTYRSSFSAVCIGILAFLIAPAAHAQFLINGRPYILADPSEIVVATFTQPDGGVTASSYNGYVRLNVTGVGQSYGATFNDAFYLYTAPFATPQNGHDGGYYQLTYAPRPLVAFDLSSNARNSLYGPVPSYNPHHDYTVILNTGLIGPSQLHFGVSDGGFSDNTGAYTIRITQLVQVPEPSAFVGTVCLLAIGGTALLLRRRRKVRA
jgi:hypothetical protein